MENSLNNFGGVWTETKITTFLNYLKSYLTIMAKQDWVQLMYFDGFAGCGNIENDHTESDSVAIRVIEFEHPRKFDMYYLVELNQEKADRLKAMTEPHRLKGEKIYIACADCNEKLEHLADFLKKNPKFRALAFIDPFGMEVKWDSIESLKGLGIDMWILVPTGIGVNRMLPKHGSIPDSWFLKLEEFTGINREEIRKRFYKKKANLFGEEAFREDKVIEKACELYSERLNTIFKYVSKPLPLANTNGTIIYHFLLATNNLAGLKIADHINKS